MYYYYNYIKLTKLTGYTISIIKITYLKVVKLWQKLLHNLNTGFAWIIHFYYTGLEFLQLHVLIHLGSLTIYTSITTGMMGVFYSAKELEFCVGLFLQYFFFPKRSYSIFDYAIGDWCV